MKHTCQSILPLLICCLLAYTATSQNAVSVIDPLTKAEDSVITLYHHFVQPETNLYNGIEYTDYTSTLKEGDPFYKTKELQPNTILYNGLWYKNIPLVYDEIKNIVVIYNPSHDRKISLQSEKIAEFTLANHRLIRLVKDSLHQSNIQTGFYDLLYQGKISLLKKPSKSIQESVSLTEGLKRYVVETSNYFVYKEGAYYAINNKASLLNLFQDHKKQIQHFIRQKKIRLSDDKEEALTELIAFCNSF